MSMLSNKFLSCAATFAPADKPNGNGGKSPKLVKQPDWVTNQDKWDSADEATRKMVVKLGPDDDDTLEYRAPETEETEDETEQETEQETETSIPANEAMVIEHIGAKITPDMIALVKEGYAAHQKDRGVPIHMAEDHVKKIWGESGDELPHSKWRQSPENNRPHNIYQIDVQSKKLGWTKKDRFVLDAVFDKHMRPDLAARLTELRAIPKTEKDDSDNRLKDANAERTKQKAYFINAVNLVKVQAMLDEYCDHIGWRYDLVKGTNEINYSSLYPIIMWRWFETGKKHKDGTPERSEVGRKSLSIDSFTDLDVIKAMQHPDFNDPVKQLEVVVNTTFPKAQRKPGGSTNQTAGQGQSVTSPDNVVINNANQIDSAFAALAAGTQSAQFVGTIHDLLNKKNAKGEYENNDLLESMAMVARWLDRQVMSNPEYEKRILALFEAKTQKKAA